MYALDMIWHEYATNGLDMIDMNAQQIPALWRNDGLDMNTQQMDWIWIDMNVQQISALWQNEHLILFKLSLSQPINQCKDIINCQSSSNLSWGTDQSISK